ncbi:HAMP domain-containing sensor histidine kinase [Nocardioides sp. CN2-186]|uniref:sensor histidine kinase n=1 Tax=Nocardioides tweenelious TaxID=3156607 RepID=UPI0032B4543E
MAFDDAGPSGSDHTGWSDSSARAVLQLMVESVAELVGFEIATLSVVLDGDVVTVAYTGPEEHRDYLMNAVDPIEILDPILEKAESWGRFKFLDADVHQVELEGHWVMFPRERDDDPESWHPANVLLGVLSDDDGQMVGVLSVDRPVSGRRPDAAQRSLMEKFAAQAERAVLTAFEREALVQQVAYAESARQLIRSASMPAHASLQAVLQHTHVPLVKGFGAGGSWIQVLDPVGVGYARKGSGDMLDLSDDLIQVAHELAPALWAAQEALIVTVGESPEVPEEVHRELADMGVTSALAVALGAGTECVGFLALSRFEEHPPWSPVEIRSALEIGHDLGAALKTAQALERERQLVRELQQLDDYRSQLIATLSHELRTPLAVIAGNLEMLGGLDLEPLAVRYQEAMERGSRRMTKVVEDLLLLARVSDPQHPLERKPVDVRRVVGDVLALVDSTARTKGLTMRVDLGDDLVVPGDPTELDRLVGNLVSNAVKYTQTGGTVTVSAERRAETVVLEVADDGLGISEDDQVGLFKAFFRTTNPDALREPGTGLGLRIVATVAERHEGKVDIRSALGVGTTFTVTLPAWPV